MADPIPAECGAAGLHRQSVGVALGLLLIDIELLADFIGDDFRQRRAPIGCLPDQGSTIIEPEECESAVDTTIISSPSITGGDCRASRDVFFGH
jgi:hypothetical protein